jgi:hypothetical protein
MIDNILTNAMLPTLSTELLGRMAEGRAVAAINITTAGEELAYVFVEPTGDDAVPVDVDREPTEVSAE